MSGNRSQRTPAAVSGRRRPAQNYAVTGIEPPSFKIEGIAQKWGQKGPAHLQGIAQNGGQNSSARRKHTAHHSPLSQVHYRHHPLFGQDVRVVRALRQRGAPSVIIELPDGAQIAVPKWMLDPLRCRSMREEDTPIIAIGALVELSALVRLLTPSPSSERPHIVDLEGGPDDAARRPTASAGAPDTVEIHTRGTASTEDRHD